MGISNLLAKILEIVRQSAVSDHRIQCNCLIDLDHFDIPVSDAKNSDFLLKKTY